MSLVRAGARRQISRARRVLQATDRPPAGVVVDDPGADDAAGRPSRLSDLDGVEVACQTAMPAAELGRDLLGRVAVEGEREGRNAPVHRGSPYSGTIVAAPARNRSPSVVLVRLDRGPADRVEVRDAAMNRRAARAQRACLVASPGRLVRRGPHLVRAPALEQLAAGEGEAEVRPVELVRRAEQDVDAERGDVDRPVRGEVDGVCPGERARPRGRARPPVGRRSASRPRWRRAGRRRPASGPRAAARGRRGRAGTRRRRRRSGRPGRGHGRARATARRCRRGRGGSRRSRRRRGARALLRATGRS